MSVVAVPTLARNMPVATPAPVPELDPHGHVAGSHGLRGRASPDASVAATFPVMTAPPRRILATTGASQAVPHAGSSTGLSAQGESAPAAGMSLRPMGMP